MENRRKFIKRSITGGIVFGGSVLLPMESVFAQTSNTKNMFSNETFECDGQLCLSRYLPDLDPIQDIDLTHNKDLAMYKPIFGEGDKDESYLNGISRIGELTVEPGGSSAVVRRPNEEYILYVTQGKGELTYNQRKVVLRASDYLYVPAGAPHGISNRGAEPIKVLFFGYRLGDKKDYAPSEELLMANSDDVQLQVLGKRPTTQYKLLMGDTTSKRDRLAAASLMKSLFIMDFSPGGTNNQHNHESQEEVYLILQGSGNMIIGKDGSGNPMQVMAKKGDVFYWAPGTEMGFVSLNKEGEDHSIILAIRSDDPTQKMNY